ncbi:MAG: RHS repeat-associated core domain-containing protein [Bacteroidales bacterium]|nr:RHS repeat-associated core domain-containing protein [Bacteroidales bacterium]
MALQRSYKHPLSPKEKNADDVCFYFYHGDHLGSASWKKERFGKPFASERAEEARSGIPHTTSKNVQHLQYKPFGEPYIDQRVGGYQERYTFTGKERDEETGYGYFGARYMDHELMTMWLSVDPMADKYPNISPYAYCAWNPVKLVDPDGMELADFYDVKGQYLGTDGINDGRIFIVTDESEIEKIIDNDADCSIRVTDANSIESKYEVLPQTLRERIITDLEGDYSNQKNREYGGVVIQQLDGTIELAHYNPGPEYQEDENGSIATVICDADKWVLNNCTNTPPVTRYHCHGSGLNQNPSVDDYDNYTKSPTQYGYAMQMGMVSRTVNFYNGGKKDPIFSMSFETFKTLGR